jgi:guanylate kinase
MSANLFVIIGPSAVGKNALLNRLRGSYPGVEKIVSATTRPPRREERDGADYRFVTTEEFLRMERAGMLAEWTEFEGHLYGTPIDLLLVGDSAGTRHIVVVDTVGAKAIKAKLGDGAATIFVMPPSEDALRRRFMDRGNAYKGENVEGRMARARRDMAMAGDFDHTVVNDDIDSAVSEVAQIMGLR